MARGNPQRKVSPAPGATSTICAPGDADCLRGLAREPARCGATKGKALATTLLAAISLSVAARAQTAAKEARVEEHLARAAALEKNRSYAQAETECRAALESDQAN